MTDILSKIVEYKRIEVESMRQAGIYNELRSIATESKRGIISMSRSISESSNGIIAEFKRRSPSKGEINRTATPGATVKSYFENGAAASSVLTDTHFFGGSVTDLMQARSSSPLMPLIRKEFVIDENQIYEARAIGADAILLIASILDKETVSNFTATACSLGLEVLLEIHSVDELDRYSEGITMIGVNNRDLSSFKTDIANSRKLAEQLPSGVIKIAESGIKTPEELLRLRDVGFDGFLIGETFMRGQEPGIELRNFIDDLKR